jgi:hypothetical protein
MLPVLRSTTLSFICINSQRGPLGLWLASLSLFGYEVHVCQPHVWTTWILLVPSLSCSDLLIKYNNWVQSCTKYYVCTSNRSPFCSFCRLRQTHSCHVVTSEIQILFNISHTSQVGVLNLTCIVALYLWEGFRNSISTSVIMECDSAACMLDISVSSSSNFAHSGDMWLHVTQISGRQLFLCCAETGAGIVIIQKRSWAYPSIDGSDIKSFFDALTRLLAYWSSIKALGRWEYICISIGSVFQVKTRDPQIMVNSQWRGTQIGTSPWNNRPIQYQAFERL